MWPNHSLRIKTVARNFCISCSGANLALLRTIFSKRDFDFVIGSIENYFSLSSVSSFKERIDVDKRTYLANNILPLTDKASMTASVEARVPYLDNHLVNFVKTLPEKFLNTPENPKKLLKDAFSDLVPINVLQRGKQGFNAPLATWAGDQEFFSNVQSGSGLHEVIGDILDVNLLRAGLAGNNDIVQSCNTMNAIFVLDLWLKSRQTSFNLN
jgi:hypothetical protein